jgi:hypothetical protein
MQNAKAILRGVGVMRKLERLGGGRTSGTCASDPILKNPLTKLSAYDFLKA